MEKMIFKFTEKPEITKTRVKPNIFFTALGLLGFALSTYMNGSLKSGVLYKPDGSWSLPLNPTYI